MLKKRDMYQQMYELRRTLPETYCVLISLNEIARIATGRNLPTPDQIKLDYARYFSKKDQNDGGVQIPTDIGLIINYSQALKIACSEVILADYFNINITELFDQPYRIKFVHSINPKPLSMDIYRSRNLQDRGHATMYDGSSYARVLRERELSVGSIHFASLIFKK